MRVCVPSRIYSCVCSSQPFYCLWHLQGVIARVVKSIDTDGNGKLDFNEFVAAFQTQVGTEKQGRGSKGESNGIGAIRGILNGGDVGTFAGGFG